MIYRRAVFLVLCISVLSMTACTGKKKADTRVAALFGSKTVKKSGEEILKGLSTATVEAYRIGDRTLTDAERKAGKTKHINWFPILSGPVKVTQKQQERVIRVLNDPKTYRFNSAKACKFNPGVALRFKDKEITTDLIFCFKCKEFRITINDQRANSEDFDGAYGELVALVKELFPKDKAIQGLKEK